MSDIFITGQNPRPSPPNPSKSLKESPSAQPTLPARDTKGGKRGLPRSPRANCSLEGPEKGGRHAIHLPQCWRVGGSWVAPRVGRHSFQTLRPPRILGPTSNSTGLLMKRILTQFVRINDESGCGGIQAYVEGGFISFAILASFPNLNLFTQLLIQHGASSLPTA